MPEELPVHVAIIMDGNGRWAREKGWPRIRGHEKGVESIREIIKACGDIGIRYLTLYAFSTENWTRPKEEIDFLMNLLSLYLDKERDGFLKNNIRFNAIGRLSDLPADVQKKLARLMQDTRGNGKLFLTLALSYSSRIELADAVRNISGKVLSGELRPEAITPETIESHLYTSGMPDPDLLIRTSGEMRLSNFLLWQLSYAELYITEKRWPDFGKEDLLKAVQEYSKRERRFGRTEAIPKKQ